MTTPDEQILALERERDGLLEAVKNLMAENQTLTRKMEGWLHAPPAQMSSPDGLLDINSTGMRHAIDKWVEYRDKVGMVMDKYMELAIKNFGSYDESQITWKPFEQ